MCVKHPHAQSTSFTWKAHACALRQRALGYTGASVDHRSAISILACKNISGMFLDRFGFPLKQREAVVTLKYYTCSFHQSLYLCSLEKISIWYMNIVLCCVLLADKHCFDDNCIDKTIWPTRQPANIIQRQLEIPRMSHHRLSLITTNIKFQILCYEINNGFYLKKY